MNFKLKEYLQGSNWLFVVTVAMPTVLSVIYFSLVASDVYTSESQFVVRSPERQTTSMLGSLFRTAGFSRSQDDSFTVREYVLSRDALIELRDQVDLDKAYASNEVDRLSRFSGLDIDNSFEALHRYYKKMVNVQTDSTSSITTLSVKAFTARDAFNANRVLLEQSERLVNRLNERGRQDMITFAQKEVEQAEGYAKAAALSLSAFRNKQGVVDPERQATAQLQQVAKLQDELITSGLQLSQLKEFTPQNPQIPFLRSRIKELDAEIQKEKTKVTGGQKSLADKSADFQRLALESEFTNKQLASTLASLEVARNEAQRQQVYLERVAQPSLPDVAQEPRRLRSVFATFILGLLAWAIFSMLLAGVREHQD